MTIPTQYSGSKSKFSKKVGFATFASTMVLTSLIASQRAMAQENDDESVTEEEVIVTGVRQSLMNAQDIKRSEDTFVDAISASDIGALPDRSVLEAIQRLPGVSVERFASSSDPDRFSSEGSGAVVRGMTATRTEFNGRDSFTASSARGLSFQDISPELMQTVKLYKNQTADMIEGGIGGTVAMYTRKPFDQPGRLIAFSADHTYFDLSKDTAPSISGLLSNRWDTDAGEFGALVSLARGRSKGQSDDIQLGYFNTNPTSTPNEEIASNSTLDQVRYPSGSNLGTKLDERERLGSAISLQFQNNDETVLATFDWIRSDSSLKWTERKMSVGRWDTNLGRFSRPAEGTSWTFDDTGTFSRGIVAHSNDGWRAERLGNGGYDNLRIPDGYDRNNNYCYDPALADEVTADDDCNLRSLTYGAPAETTSRIQWGNTLVDDYSFNLKLNPSDKWEVIADFQYIDASSSQTDMTITTGFRALNYMDASGSIPQMGIINPWSVVPDENYPDPNPDDDVSFDTIGYMESYEADPANEGVVPIDRFATDYFNQPSSYWWDNANDTYMRATGEEKAFRLDGTYHFEDDNFLKSVQMGARMSSRQQQVWDVAYSNWGALSGLRGLDTINGETGYAAAWLDFYNNPDYETYDWSDFYRGDGTYMGVSSLNGSSVTPNSDGSQFLLIHPSMDLIKRYSEWTRLFSDVIYQGADNAWEAAEFRDENNDGVIDTQGYFLPEELSDIEEINQSAYVRLDFGTDNFFGLRMEGNVGLRYYQVNLESTGYVRFPDLRPTERQGEDDSDWLTNVNNFLSPTETDFANNATELTFAENDYSHVLPSFNMKLEFTDDLLARFAVSKAVSLPDIGDLRSYVNIGALLNPTVYAELEDDNDTLAIREIEEASVNSWTASGGNPYLVPMESIQFDASLEWYFADVGSLTTSIFYKDLKNFFVDGAFARPITNPTTGVTQDVLVSGKVNAGEGSLEGFEVAYQQYFDMLPEPFDGIGVQINYTYIDVDGVPNPALEGADDNRDPVLAQRLPLQSQSKDTANFALMYEKYGFEFRTAYNWRSSYLVTARDGSNYPFPPTWSADAGYLDASLFYALTDDIKIGFQGNNLTDSIAETQFQSTDSLELNGRSWFMNDRRYTFVVRAQF